MAKKTFITHGDRFKFDKPLVESSLPPSSTNVYWVIRDGNTGKLTEIREYKFETNTWESIMVIPVTPTPAEVLELTDMFSYGVRWTREGILESPELERIGNPALYTPGLETAFPIQEAFKGCVCQEDEIEYYLDPEDWSKKADGTASKLDGTDGTVRVHTPKFYLKSTSYKRMNASNQIENVREVRISQFNLDGTWKEIPSCVIDAYPPTLQIDADVTLANFKAVSVNVQGAANLTSFIGGAFNDWYTNGGSDWADIDNDGIDSAKIYTNEDIRLTDYGKPLTGLRRATARHFANQAGSELLSYFIYKALYWCMVIEYATFDLMLPVDGEADEDGIVRYQPGVGGIGIGLRNGNNIIDENGDAGSSNGGGIFNKSSYTNGYGRYGSRTPNGWTDKLGNGTGSRVLFEAGETVGTAATALIQDVCAFRWRGFENFCGDQYIFLDGWVTGNFAMGSGDDGYQELITEEDWTGEDAISYDSDTCRGLGIYVTEKSECLDDTFANKEISFVLPRVKDGDCGVVDYDLGDSGDIIPINGMDENGSIADDNYHIGMCDYQSYPSNWDFNSDDGYFYWSDSPWNRYLLCCGAYSHSADAYYGPGYFSADHDLEYAYGNTGFRTLNRNPHMAR